MVERFCAANGIGPLWALSDAVRRRRFLTRPAGAERRIFLYRGANNADLFKLKAAHFAGNIQGGPDTNCLDEAAPACRW